eukprot:COSAG05_NODE_4852_length_1348_cov_1.028022_2_plen_380_part_01
MLHALADPRRWRGALAAQCLAPAGGRASDGPARKWPRWAVVHSIDYPAPTSSCTPTTTVRELSLPPCRPPCPAAHIARRSYCALAESALRLLGCQFTTQCLAYDDVETPTRLAGKKLLPILTGDAAPGAASAMAESLQICWHAGVLAGRQLTGHPPDEQAAAWLDDWIGRFTDVSALLCLPRWVAQRQFTEFATDSACEYYVSRKQEGWAGELERVLGQGQRRRPRATPETAAAGAASPAAAVLAESAAEPAGWWEWLTTPGVAEQGWWAWLLGWQGGGGDGSSSSSSSAYRQHPACSAAAAPNMLNNDPTETSISVLAEMQESTPALLARLEPILTELEDFLQSRPGRQPDAPANSSDSSSGGCGRDGATAAAESVWGG